MRIVALIDEREVIERILITDKMQQFIRLVIEQL